MSIEHDSDARTGLLSLNELLRAAAATLASAGVPTPEVDAELLVAHVLGIGRGEIAAARMRGDSAPTGEPADRIAQLAIDALRAVADAAPVAVDLGTGSGALALALATEVPHARVHAAENSVEAFVWAKENFAAHAPAARLAFVDLASAFPELDGRVDVLVSNPPYVPDAAIPRDPEVRHWDPPAALYGGEDGLDVVRTLSGVGMRLLRPGGALVIEHGEWQGAPIRQLLAQDGWRAASTHPDLTGRDRATTALRP